MDENEKVSAHGNRTGAMSLMMTIFVLIFIVSIIGIAKWSLKNNEEESKQTFSDRIKIIDNTGLNAAEAAVLTKLSQLMEVSGSMSDEEGKMYTIYYYYLNRYYRNSTEELNESTSEEIENLIKNGEELISLEKEMDINKMSFDGREVAIYILKRIYELSGMQLILSADGQIEQITKHTGEVIYANGEQQAPGFRYDVLFIIIALLFGMIILCFIIAKRNQLLKKGGGYSGFKEKGIA